MYIVFISLFESAFGGFHSFLSMLMDIYKNTKYQIIISSYCDVSFKVNDFRVKQKKKESINKHEIE